MQNTPQTFRGVGAPGVNFNDHSYDNHIGGHCQPAGYQPYSSPPYHPSPRPHHYAPPNHQMQPGMPPYRHHAYPQQYGVSQQPHDMYRNHHSGYRMPAKPWPENNNNNNGAPYGSHPQMQQPMNALRSPPHVNAPPPPQNHFRQMQQSPAHSPHSSWSQVPSPMHRTTPSPAHTPGQFPTPPHQENGGVVDNPGNPLHSLQKMVMLDQDKMMVDEQFQNQCVPHNYMPEESTESKDSSYSTYYNMDENRFESKPNAAAGAYSVQVSPNCNYPVPQLNNAVEEAKGPSSIPAPLSNSSIPDGLSSDHSSLSSPSSVPLMPCSSSVNDHPLTLNDCPQHAESAPVFNDQTQAAVSNSEQALESRVGPKPVFDIPSGDTPAADVPNSLPVAAGQEALVVVKSEKTNQNETVHSDLGSEVPTNDIKNVKDDIGSNSQNAVPECKEEKCDPEIPKNEKYNPAIIKVQAEVHNSDVDTELICEGSKNSEGPSDKTASPEGESSTLKSEKDIENVKLSPKSENLSVDSDESKLKELARNPVKVVIHRIRKDDTNDTWHVPGNESAEEDKKPEVAKIPSVGPQIVILSPAVPQKKFGFHSSVTENNVITIDEDDSVEALDKDEPATKSPGSKGESAQSPDKKRGRPVGSKNRLKPAGVGKRKRGGGKGSRKRKAETKAAAEPPKSIKKGKAFNGPYVHIVGSRENPSSIKVVNVAQQKEEEKVSAKPSAPKRNFASAASSRMKKKPVGHLSTLSPTYDAFNRDKTWLCVFCQKGSHQGGLGDLYGPYYIKDKEGASKMAASNSSVPARRKRCRSEADEGRSSAKKTKQASGHTPIESTPVKSAAHTSSSSSVDSAESPDLREVWIHEDCAVWCQSISLIGEEVQGLEEAVLEAREHICCKCSFHGATLGCWGKCCKEQYHFSCAKEIGCQMDIENFSLLCLKHQKKSPERRK